MAKVHFRSYNDNKMVLFPQRIDKDTSEGDPVRLLNRQKTERKTKLFYTQRGVLQSLFGTVLKKCVSPYFSYLCIWKY